MYKSGVGARCDPEGGPWSGAGAAAGLQVTLRAAREGTPAMPSPLEQALHLLGTSSASLASPAIFTFTWDFLEHFPALPEEIHSPGAGGRPKMLL